MNENPEITPGKIIARVAAGAALTISAGHASASLDKLATWFLAGFGVGFALTLSSLKEISEFIPPHSIASVAYLFLWASIFCLAQRYVAMVVGCGVSSAKDGREMGEKLEHMDSKEFIAQMKAGIPALLRPFSNGLLNAVAKGDFAAGGRLFLRLTLIQGLLASAEVIVLLVALSNVANEIRA
jgi:hypothetical protein